MTMTIYNFDNPVGTLSLSPLRFTLMSGETLPTIMLDVRGDRTDDPKACASVIVEATDGFRHISLSGLERVQ